MEYFRRGVGKWLRKRIYFNGERRILRPRIFLQVSNIFIPCIKSSWYSLNFEFNWRRQLTTKWTYSASLSLTREMFMNRRKTASHCFRPSPLGLYINHLLYHQLFGHEGSIEIAIKTIQNTVSNILYLTHIFPVH